MTLSGGFYLFPFGKIPKGSRIVLYGAGTVGQAYLRQILRTEYCTVVALADRSAADYQDFVVPVCLPEQIPELSFDFVLLTVKSAETRKEFRSLLTAEGVPIEKIVEDEEQNSPVIFRSMSDSDGTASETSYTQGILCYMAGGMGDVIVAKKAMELLIEMDDALSIDIICSFDKAFMEFLYRDTPQVKVIRQGLKAQYQEKMQWYQAAIFFNGTSWTRIDYLHRPTNLPINVFRILEDMKKRGETEDYFERIPSYVFYQRSIFKNENCYQHICDGLPYRDWHIQIPQTPQGKKDFRAMKLGRYLTINYGNVTLETQKKISKSWPLDRFVQLISLLHEAYPDIEIVQVGAADAIRLDGADCYALGHPFDVLCEIMRHSILHIDIEGGLVHLASQLGTKCAVLFGQTQVEFFGYPQNINIMSQEGRSCHGCCHLYRDFQHCARDLKEPECMYSITPEMVMGHITQYLNNKRNFEKARRR